MWRVVLGVLLSGFLALAAAARVEGAYDRFELEPVDENYLTGYLVWSANVGSISWDPAAVSEDPAGPSEPARGAVAFAAWNLKGFAGTDAGLTPSIKFTSAPLPFRLDLNVSRLIQVDLFVPAAGSCTEASPPSVELRVGNVFVGGLMDGMSGTNLPFAPSPPPGYCIIFYRIHPEVAFLEKGAVLELGITYHARYFNELVYQPAQKYGAKGDHRSVIRLAAYSEDDLLIRTPRASSTPDDAEAGGLAVLVPIAGLTGLGLARRGRWLLVAVLVLSAGCVGGGSPTVVDPPPDETAPSGSASYTIEPGNGTQGGTGSIFGVVQDESAAVVEGAAVSLLSTPHFARSDSLGRFRFEGLAPGTYSLRVDRVGLHSLEAEVEVAAGRMTRVDVTLRFAVASEKRAHAHDLWGDRTVVDWFERDVSVAGASSGNPKSCYGGPMFTRSYCPARVPMPPAATDGSALVLPGTYEVEVTITWDPLLNRVPWMGLAFRANDDPGYQACPTCSLSYNWTPLYPRASGVPFHIRANWEMGDVGHQTFSAWRFEIYVPMEGSGAALLQAPFHVSFRLHKGVVPLEPAHRDFWNGATVLPILEASSLQTECGPQCASGTYPDFRAVWVPPRLVPPGTAKVSVVLEQEKATLPTPISFGLLYRPGNVPPPDDTGDFSKFKKASPEKSEPLRKEYVLLLAAEEADAFYSKRSNWEFALDDGVDGRNTVVNGPIGFKLTVTAHKVPPEGGASGLLARLL